MLFVLPLFILQKFGDVDMSSGKNFYSSIRKSSPPKSAHSLSAVDNIPSALPGKNNLGTPLPTAAVSSAAPSRQSEPEPGQEEQGVWAEALYDFESSVSVWFAAIYRTGCSIRTLV